MARMVRMQYCCVTVWPGALIRVATEAVSPEARAWEVARCRDVHMRSLIGPTLAAQPAGGGTDTPAVV